MILRKLPVVFGIVLLVAVVLTTYAVNQPGAPIRGPDQDFTLAAASATAAGVIPLPPGESGSISPPLYRASCTLARTDGTAAYYWDSWVLGDGLATMMNPADCGSTPTYPFEIIAVDLTLYDFGVNWPVTIDVAIYEAIPDPVGDDTCWYLGQELCRQSAVCDQATFAYPTVGAVDFVDPCCVYGPFFVSMEYVSGTTPLPSFMWDGQITDTCFAWQNTGGVWVEQKEHHGPGGPGYNLIWVHGETESPNCGPETCNWEPGDPHKMHYPQLPDTMGWDVNATFPIQLADDWECSETGWVQDIHFWGSWRENQVGEILQFNITVYNDIPAEQSETGYSMPGGAIWFGEFPGLDVTQYDPETLEGWFDPLTGEIIPSSIYSYWQYDICLDETMQFWQDSGVIYWVSIQAIVTEPALFQWGWKSTEFHWNDDAVWDDTGGQDWRELYEPGTGGTWDTLVGSYGIVLDNGGWLYDWIGENYYGEGWYYYEWYNWWNMWFYDHPYDSTRYKTGWLDLLYINPWEEGPFFAEIAINWSTDAWSWEQPPDDSIPPMPWDNEDLYIGRQIIYATDEPVSGLTLEYEIPDYNPEWVSIDVRGYNFISEGVLYHSCRPKYPEISLDLAFVITGEAPPPPEGACCDSAGNCFIMVESECDAIGGLFEGAGTTCDPNPCDTCDFQFPGDFDDNGTINVNDLVDLVSYLYQGGAAPLNPANADPNGDCCIDWRDVKILVDSLFGPGATLADCTCRNPQVCIEPPPDHTVGSVYHNTDGYVPNMGPPYGTNWHELYPEYCTYWDMVGWEDNGDGLLSFCDTIYLARLPADTIREHVIKVMPTLTLLGPTGGEIFVDLISPDNPFMDPSMDYWGSFWHEVYPNYCRKYQIVWLTDIFNGTVNMGDEIMLQALNGPDSGTTYNYPVTNIETDMITEKLSCCRYRGDINHDGAMGGVPLIDDLVYLTTFMFQSGPCGSMCDDNPAPGCNSGEIGTLSETDVNGDGNPMPLIDDLVWLTTYMFQNGPEPVGWINYTTPACVD